MLKDKIYFLFVKTNPDVCNEYENYVMQHIEEHNSNRMKHWLILLWLNIHYRILGRKSVLLKKQEAVLQKSDIRKVDTATDFIVTEQGDRVFLSWRSEADICNIYRSSYGEKYNFLAKVSGTRQYIDKNILPGKDYYYKIKVSENGECYSAFSAEKHVQIREINSSHIDNREVHKEKVPAKAQCVSASSLDRGICLRWQSDAGICNIYRSQDGKDFKFLAKVFDQSQYLDIKVKPSTKYHYRLKMSYNDKNFSGFSDVVCTKSKDLTKYEMIYGKKLLPEGGSESSINKRINAIVFAKSLVKYDVISFDVFDTLIFRPFQKPSDLFMLVGQKLHIMDYCNIRMDAEEAARKKNFLLRGNREVTIDEIYQIVSEQTGISKNEGIRTEFEIELDLCYVNPYMHRVFELLKYQGKKLVIVSDMYYPKEYMVDLLEHVGYTGYEEVIVSCDYNCSKRDGRLFDILKEKYLDTPNIVHIGDNMVSDIKQAKERGIEAVHYLSIQKRGDSYRATNMSYLVGSAYQAIVNSQLHNGLYTYSPYYEVGFVYAGLYVTGFCNWLHENAKKKGITKLLFLAREGDIYQRVFRTMFDDVETEYVLWSRVPVVKTTVRKNRHPYLLQLVHHKAHALYKSKVSILFDRVGIGDLKQYFKDYRINDEEYLTENNEKIVERLLIDHWDELCECYRKDEQHIRDYLKEIVGKHKSVAVIDVGWSGNNVLQVKYLLEEIYHKTCSVTCYLAATRNVNDTYMASMMLSEEVETYIFSNMQNKDLHDFHQNTNNHLNSFFFEILTQSCTPTFLGFQDERFLYDIPEVENFVHNREIHTGILDFAVRYSTTFRNYPYMLNISGYDAYMPFRLFVSDLSWLRTYFSDYVFGRDLFATQERAVMETVKEVMDKANV